MGLTEGRAPRTIWKSPAALIRALAPDHPVMVLDTDRLAATARRFLEGFPGMVTYAVKANPDRAVIRTLVRAGITGFDVASPAEIDLIGQLAPGAARHYHNPVRARGEIRHAVAAGMQSWSVDSQSELDKLLAELPPQSEIAARFKLPVAGAAYDFGAKFGATPDLAATLLRRIAAGGHRASLTFHPGTQCTDPAAWESYILAAAGIARAAGITLCRLNVGGGFPAHRLGAVPPQLEAIFARIDHATSRAFGRQRPGLVCEPGRGLCADAFALITRVKALRDGRAVFLNDGIYGGLTELPQIGNLDRIEVLDPEGRPRHGPPLPRPVFGPTCDSLDRLPGELPLPADLAEGDYLIFHGAGAYSTVTNTRFNGFGQMSRLFVKTVS
ncbi:type III PLP-dependent enzyme [Paracoccus limosus]|uniref:ornithine decarboxylase n=1 Tax=Paracoccus limosus TaxID=913252 RepID=A0A844H7N2_9RHOB|nr:type III PLP-dependent enzyme [Paracoccus limosus]MTH34507.1 type III PLP-dependent enzyme [Paracoccus limosus]